MKERNRDKASTYNGLAVVVVWYTGFANGFEKWYSGCLCVLMFVCLFELIRFSFIELIRREVFVVQRMGVSSQNMVRDLWLVKDVVVEWK